jgi:hypothetical protein
MDVTLKPAEVLILTVNLLPDPVTITLPAAGPVVVTMRPADPVADFGD